MNWIRINDEYINLDQVTDATYTDLEMPSITLWLTSLALPEDDSGIPVARATTFVGQEAVALRSWLDGRASNVLRLYEIEQAVKG